MDFKRFSVAVLAALIMLPACVKVNGQLGENLIATDQQYDTYTVDIPLTETKMEMADSLSGYSNTRLTIGAVRDDVFGETLRGAAFTLIPALDTIDFGEKTVIDGISYPEVKRVHIAFAADTVSVPAGDRDRYILQNIDVFPLTEPLNLEKIGTNNAVQFDASRRISVGIPVYAGKDSLSFDFTKEFAMSYIDGIREVARDGKILITREDAQPGDTVSMEAYTAKLPGVYVRMLPGSGNGGRINMFDFSCLTLTTNGTTNYYARNRNVATLRIRGVYDGAVKDTAFLFVPGETGFVDEIEAVLNNVKFAQYAFNYTGQSTKALAGKATDRLLVEGGGGLKPVIQASELRDKVIADIVSKGGDPARAVINLATVYLPFEEPADFRELDLFPTTLSPTCMIKGEDETYSFNGLPDAAASVEDQGGINRSMLRYQPDITWHLQEIIRLKDEDLSANPDKINNYDIWLLTIHDEVVESAATSSYDQEYLQQLMYYNYMNNLYGGYGGYGYGGYGYGYGYGYGGYGYDSYGYSNYYNMMMLSAMYANAGNTSTTTSTLDKDRYYKGILNGPGENGPYLTVTYGIPKE